MKRKLGIILMVIGLISMAVAVGLMIYNSHMNKLAGKNAEHYLKLVKDEIKHSEEQVSQNENVKPSLTPVNPFEEKEEEILPSKNLNGHEYIGFLTVPSKELELPILKNYKYSDLDISPCRFDNGLSIEGMVIAGHNYWTHFRPLQDIETGAEIFFTDMNGKSYRYKVDDVEVLKPTQVDEMVASGFDLTLFTCTYARVTRLAVRCMLVK